LHLDKRSALQKRQKLGTDQVKEKDRNENSKNGSHKWSNPTSFCEDETKFVHRQHARVHPENA
jgi:hypothetical protein